MGMSPITSLGALTLARPVDAALEPLPMARVENSARNGDESYSPSGGKPDRGSADNESEEALDDLLDEVEILATAPAKDQSETRQISFFA
jgi:hypothetical protein